jgi:hypothetical protein
MAEDKHAEDKYRVVCFMRVDTEPEGELFSLEEAKADVRNMQVMMPENYYTIEKVEDEDNVGPGNAEEAE